MMLDDIYHAADALLIAIARADPDEKLLYRMQVGLTGACFSGGVVQVFEEQLRALTGRLEDGEIKVTEMSFREVIDAAKDILITQLDLSAHLSQHGSVRVFVPRPPVTPVTPEDDTPNKLEPGPHQIVEFQMMDHPVFGRRLLAKYDGKQEFVA